MLSPRIIRSLLILLALLALYAVGLGMRREVLHAQYVRLGPDFPFTLESALQFRNVRLLYEGESLPEIDRKIQYPEGVVTREHDTIGAEYVYALAARFLPGTLSLGDRVRWITAAWFCLGIPMMALWAGWRFRSHTAGFFAAAFYAVSLSAVIRSTGQELSRENFAFPFLIAHLAFAALAERGATGRIRWAGAVLSAAGLALALMTWDLIQFYIILWAVAGYVGMVRGDPGEDSNEGFCPDAPSGRMVWALQAAALFLAGGLNPNLRSHYFLLSPGMLMVYGTALGWCLSGRSTRQPGAEPPIRARGLAGWRAVLGAVPLAAVSFWPGRYGEAYGHFMELLMAKIRFRNIKPEDPSLLTFDQRIMWTPGLNSSDWALTEMLFPYILPLSLVALGVAAAHLYRNRRAARATRLLQYSFFFISSLITYVLFARFHVYLALFSAGLMGWFAAWAVGRVPWIKWTVLTFLVLGLYVEAAHVWRTPEAWGRPGVYYHELTELTDWLEEFVSPSPVVANFGVSGSIAAYGGCPVVLHPKFETREIRERVRAYGEALFKGTERDFRDWADRYGAEYYVHALGEFYPRELTMQMRYMVDALEPPDYAAVHLFESQPYEPVYFEWLWGNRKYRVFRIVTRKDEERAWRLARAAEERFQHGELDEAEELAVQALALFPNEGRALTLMRHIGSLRDQGFGVDTRE